MSSSDPNRPRSSQEPNAPASDSPQGDDVDFGAFVSSRVRASADKLKGGSSRSTTPATPSPGDTETRPAGDSTSGSRRTPADRDRKRPSRYWRESADTSGSAEEPAATGSRARLSGRTREETPVEDEESFDEAAGGFGGSVAAAQAWVRDNSEGRPWFLPALIGGAVIVLLLLIWLLSQLGGGGGGGGNVTPTATSESIIGVPGQTVTTTTESVIPTPTQPAPAPTDTVKTGGDNQRSNQSGTPAAQAAVWEDCATSCLVRAQLPADSPVLASFGARPSFSAGGWSWIVAPPGTVSDIAAKTDTVTMVQPDAETLRLYAVQLPGDVSSDDRVREYGTIVDSVDNIRLLQTDSAPGRVGPLIDAGYIVDKVTPGPAYGSGRSTDLPKLASTDIGTLTPLISNANIEQTIRDLQAMGSSDGSGLGSRYYSMVGNQMAAEYLFQKLSSYGMTVWYEDFITPDGYLLVNIVGELPASDSSKIYAVMAHMDTISSTPGTAPGADDNATGLAASLEIARILSGYQVTHPVRIVFTNAEETSLLGSDAWARRAAKEQTPIEGVFNIDSVGSERQGTAIILNGDAKSAWMMDLMVRLNDAYGIGNAVWPNQSDKIVADDNYVRAQGIESIMIARELYGQSPYHHTTGDVIDHVSIDQVSKTTAVVLLCMASLVQ
ncbi:MAG: M20/M25/M40 family metallo-hydrolase [Thermomicrobiales bacterium]